MQNMKGFSFSDNQCTKFVPILFRPSVQDTVKQLQNNNNAGIMLNALPAYYAPGIIGAGLPPPVILFFGFFGDP